MNVLLDTHAFLWWVIDDPQLSNTAKTIIADPTNTIDFSVVSAWEIIIKERTGKLALPEPPETYVPSRLSSNRFISLNVQMQHVLQIAALPDHHRDPFDRLLCRLRTLSAPSERKVTRWFACIPCECISENSRRRGRLSKPCTRRKHFWKHPLKLSICGLSVGLPGPVGAYEVSDSSLVKHPMLGLLCERVVAPAGRGGSSEFSTASTPSQTQARCLPTCLRWVLWHTRLRHVFHLL